MLASMRSLGVMLGLVLLVGCSANNSAAPATPADCVAASPKLVEQLQAGMLGETGARISRAAAVKSAEHQNAYYVAARFSATGVDDQSAVWLSNDVDGSGTIQSVDGVAANFSEFPRSTAASSSDVGVSKAKACVA